MQLRLFLYPLLFKNNAVKHLYGGSWALAFAIALTPFITALIALYSISNPNWPYSTTTKGLLLFYSIAFLFLVAYIFLVNPKNTIMPLVPTRLVITSADIIAIYGCSDSTAARKLQVLKDAEGKPDHHAVTIEDFCSYYGLNYEKILTHLKLLK